MSWRSLRRHAAHRRSRLRWLSLAALLISGCVATGPLEYVHNGFKVGPNYSPPPATVAPQWREARNPNVQNRHLQDWWDVFQDPALNTLITTAYGQNLTLRAAGMRVLQARAQQAIAVGGLFPQTQQVTGQFSQTGLSHTTFNNPAVEEPLLSRAGAILPPNFPFGNFYPDWSTGFNMSWELDFWGRFRRSIESANANFDASVAGYDDALVTLFADVATNYVQFRVAQQRIRIARDNVRIQEGILSLAAEKFRVGTASRLDVEQAKTILEQTRSTIPALQVALGQANDTLCTLLGIPPRDLEPGLGTGPELGSDPIPNTPVWVAVGIPADLLRRRPDVRRAELQVAGQSAQIGVAEADLYPTIAINGTIGWESADLSKLFESSSFVGMIAPNFKWNVLNYGRIANNVRLQQTRTLELIATYQNQVLTAGREVQVSLRSFLRSQEQAEDLARSVKAAAAARQLGMDQYKAGTVPFNTVFNLETTQVLQQDNLAVVQGNIAISLINTYRALGGGWEIRMQNDNCGGVPDAPSAPKADAPPPRKPEQLPAPKGGPEEW